MTQFGQHPPADLVIAHFSDPHFTLDNTPVHGMIDPESNLTRSLDHLERSGIRPAALVFTGDLANDGDRGAYERLRQLVDPVATRMGAEVVWVMGNHDEHAEFRAELLEGQSAELEPERPERPRRPEQSTASGAPGFDRVVIVGGLRIIVLDSTVEGFHHGDLSLAQLDWLSAELRSTAPLGTVIALHHPPLPSHVDLMTVLELRHQREFAERLVGTDVRAILAGHLHYATHGLFAGVPVNVAPSTCYTIDAGAPVGTLDGIDTGPGYSLAHFYPDNVVFSSVSPGQHRVSGFSARFVAGMASLSPEERLAAFSSKSSTISLDRIERLAD